MEDDEEFLQLCLIYLKSKDIPEFDEVKKMKAFEEERKALANK
ncbi:hypothetical protein [Aliikangiella maris]|uniref:Uncharacterized protein n=2 Tax=Aliikangiella maris TaxID=3162458 RepID=A0ABV2BSD4_9GAMM